MTKDEMAQVMEEVFERLRAVRQAGHAEYAGGEDAFGNFKKLSGLTGADQKQVLFIYMMKHIDGIASYIRGHKSQREDVRGRILDASMYLMLLHGMIEEEEKATGHA